MAFNSKSLSLSTIILFLVIHAYIVREARAAGECGRTPVDTAAKTLIPCLGATKNIRAKVTPLCCSRVVSSLQNPKCLCAIFLSPLGKAAGINLAIAITIPKRCNIKNRPIGAKCGKYRLP
ncbi:hypothetical protein GIB67_011860 [Kingdonia uniflora]|uniref:Bifunctional inhibitor/plant lipid transfer protein/seed storage helical domain-containing protein n=1 Tax=Kingdonia uniflora TaxID=39325 RepID=A0A7J7LN36_9MAGN|nr:hypothetical protein GIB67_011860 [Kingdonia uniflora]